MGWVIALPFFVEYMRRRLEVSRYSAVFECERAWVCQDGITTLIKNRRATLVARDLKRSVRNPTLPAVLLKADLARDIVFAGSFSGTKEMQAIVFVLGHPHGRLECGNYATKTHWVIYDLTLGKMTAHWKGAPCRC